ncbi:MAG: AAA family ATPase [Muribaculaceae bacterium]|nr:AAA family ATPase [Muribaculaceae bacterium]MBR0023423.1 AAA family ATPase [Muribaculaceae bacterium]
MIPFTPILEQFEAARRRKLIQVGYLDQSGNEYKDEELRMHAHSKLPRSIFSDRNDSLQARQIENAESLWENVWFESECACLFGDPNIGKSTLAFSIAHEVACSGRPVLYLDFENMMHNYFNKCWTDRQFLKPANLTVYHYDQDTSVEEMTSRETILQSIESDILDLDAPVVIIDDITHICPLRNCNKTQQVLRRLRQWINHYHVSILVIAHSTSHHEGTPLTMKHLTGDRQLAYAFDSIFTLNDIPAGTVTDGSTHYVKQLKARNAPVQLHNNAVMTLKLKTHYDEEDRRHLTELNRRKGFDDKTINEALNPRIGRRYLHFFVTSREASELQLIFLPTDATREQQLDFIHDTFSKGWSIRNIAAHTCIPKSTIHRLLATTRQQLQQESLKSSPSKIEGGRGSMTESNANSPSKIERDGESITKSNASSPSKIDQLCKPIPAAKLVLPLVRCSQLPLKEQAGGSITKSNASSPSKIEGAGGSMTKSNAKLSQSVQEPPQEKEKQGEKKHHPKTPPLNKPGSSLKKLIKLSHRCPGGG